MGEQRHVRIIIVTVRALGVSIANGVLYLAGLAAASGDDGQLGTPAGSARRIVPSVGLSDAHSVTDLRDRFKQDLRSLDMDGVALVATRQFSGLAYRVALKRVTAMSAAMIAAVELGVPFSEIKTEAIGKTVGVPAKSLRLADPKLFGFDTPPTYWTAGLADAYGAAAVLLKREAGSD